MAEKSRPSGSIEVRAQLPRLEEVLEEMDRLWESVLSLRRRPLRALAREHVFPAIDVYEAEGALHVRVELPGMRAEDVEITAGERSLTISGVKPSEAEAEKASFLRSERSRGRFSRRIVLPESADVEGATAHFEAGVLAIDVPYKPGAAKRTIQIKSE